MTIERTARGPLRTLRVHHAEHTPANKRKGQVKAHADLRATVHIGAGWLELHATEYVEGHNGMRRNMVWLTLEEEEARALYALLRERFGA